MAVIFEQFPEKQIWRHGTTNILELSLKFSTVIPIFPAQIERLLFAKKPRLYTYMQIILKEKLEFSGKANV